jgi:FAD/FMN-containing dehydrogenase
MSEDKLRAALAAIVGADHVLADEGARQLASADLFSWPEAVVADLVVRPGSTDELSRVAALLSRSGTAIVPRGAGLSYTAGVVPHGAAVVIDSLRLDRITIHADDLFAVVGAGVTWQNLAQALKPYGLRAAQINPISGSHSTVGGTASQNIPGGLDNIIGLTVVLADGTVARTGSAARADGSAFLRYAGPDLTGMFLGDCGAFGLKTEVVVRLATEGETAFASFAFKQVDDMLAALVTLRRRNLVTRAFSMDQLKGQSATRIDAAEAAGVVSAVFREAGSVGRAFKDLAQLAKGRTVLNDAGWSLHMTIEAASAAIAEAQMDLARAVCRAGGQEIDNVIPKTMRAKPYSIRGMVGPDGERWVPVHCILPLSRAQGCMAALLAKLTDESVPLSAAGVSFSWMISSSGAYVTIEPMFYWKDSLDPIHLAHLSERNRARFGGGAVNQQARTLVRRLRGELREIMRSHDAEHAQLGRFYPYLPLLEPGAQALATRIKDALDPGRRMNPGVLGLS